MSGFVLTIDDTDTFVTLLAEREKHRGIGHPGKSDLSSLRGWVFVWDYLSADIDEQYVRAAFAYGDDLVLLEVHPTGDTARNAEHLQSVLTSRLVEKDLEPLVMQGALGLARAVEREG